MKKEYLKNSDYKWGFIILFAYLSWSIAWLIYAYFVKGSPVQPYIPAISLENELIWPFKGFLLGTDLLGRSVVEVISKGLIYSMSVGVFVTFLSCAIGTIIGYMTAVGSEWLQKALDLITNLIFVFPNILLAIVFMSVIGKSLVGLIFTLVITGWAGYARIARGETKRVMGLEYVEGAKAIGVGKTRLFTHVILPAILPQLLVHMVLGISGVIIAEASLGFLGLGGSQFSWGALLSLSKDVLLEAPYLTIILSLVMCGLIMGLNLLGDGLRDLFDPKIEG